MKHSGQSMHDISQDELDHICEKAIGANAEGQRTGGITWQETTNSAHVTFFDASGTRVSYDIDSNGNFVKHETDTREPRRGEGSGARHAEGAYRSGSDAERRTYIESQSAREYERLRRA